MSRHLILLFVLLTNLLSTAVAQQAKPAPVPTLPIDPMMELVTYSDFVRVAGYTQDSLYARARQWFVRTFPPIEPSDTSALAQGGHLMMPENDITIRGKMFTAVGWRRQSAVVEHEVGNYRLHFILQFFATADHYECRFDNFEISPAPSISVLSGSPLVPMEVYLNKKDPQVRQYQDVADQYKRHVDAFAKEQFHSLRVAINKQYPARE